MPDCPKFDFDMYSGYLEVNANKSLFYTFVESMENPETDPLVIWYSGGPGCSSLLAFMQENGPCIIDDGEDFVKPNPYPWNMKANVLYIESPAGVGFSYAKNKEDMKFNDIISSHDNLASLKSFYAKFPEYENHDLYISGESYAGLYIPYLAYRIHENNELSKIDGRKLINLQGIAVGNGATDWKYDTWPSYLTMAYHHKLMDEELYKTFVDNGCEWYFRDVLPPKTSDICEEALKTFKENTARINWYDIYRKVYPFGPSSEPIGETVINGEKKLYKRGYKMTDYAPWLGDFYGESSPVLGDYFSDYFNREDVRKAMHIPEDFGMFYACTNGHKPDFEYHYQKEGSYWIYHILKANGIKIMHFSGVTDGAVPTYGTERWIKDLGWKVESDWHPWLIDDQVAGYNKVYEGLNFTTIHGVGHMAPQWKRKEVTELLNEFIQK